MAKLHDYYILCPLIDQKSFLGVAQDKEDEHVIVTLGRNVVNKYRLSDQKQVSGWTSKDHITSAAIYDKDQENYVAVFNKNMIKLWNDDSNNLDKLKKYKFTANILQLIAREDQPALVIFSNGSCASLPYAIENRKTESQPVLAESDKIVDASSFKINKVDYICYIIKTSQGYDVLHCPLRDELGDIERAALVREKIMRDDDVNVVGTLISSTDKIAVYVMWSDSKMTVYYIPTKTWKTVSTVPWLSTSSTVSMACLAKHHLILFGGNKDQDGAIIVAYNNVLGVGSCKYPMKMYKEKAKIYCFNNRIILEASNHLGMLPFSLETKRNLSSLLGSHEVIQNEHPVIANWDTPTTVQYDYIPEMKEAIELGISERNACAQIMPTIIQKYSPKKLKNVIQEFKDIPESALATLLSHAIKLIKADNVCSSPEEMKALCENEDKDKLELLNQVFRITFCDALIIPHLRNSVTLEESLFILLYIAHLLFDSEISLESDYESKLYDWCTTIADAFYQQYLMSKDSTVTETLGHLHKVVDNLIGQLFKTSETISQLHKLLSGGYNRNNEQNLPYTIELIRL